VALKTNPRPMNDKLAWRWSKGLVPLAQSDFGDPVNGSTSYTLCLYDASGDMPVLKMAASVAAGGLCGAHPCWKALSAAGWVYVDQIGAAEGITRVFLRGGGSGKAKVQVGGKGSTLPLPAPLSGTQFFNVDTAVIVQLRSSAPAHCWSSRFAALNTKKNDGTRFRAVTP